MMGGNLGAAIQMMKVINQQGGGGQSLRRGYLDYEIAALIASGYIPVASTADLYAIRTAYTGQSKREFAAGTKWATGLINTSGGSGKYIQVSDIDLYSATRTGGVYWNSGQGWNPFNTGGTFIYDGGGYIINGMYINRAEDRIGFIKYMYGGGVVRNAAFLNIEVNGAGSYIGGIAGTYATGVPITIQRCIVTGFIRHSTSAKYYTGAILGGRNATSDNAIIEDCFTNVDIYSGTKRGGGIIGHMANAESSVSRCISLGKVRTASPYGSIVGLCDGATASPIISDCYFSPESSNVDYSIGSDTYNASQASSDGARSTNELISGVKSGWLFNNFSTDHWYFRSNYFPILKIFGYLPVFIPGVRNVSGKVNIDDNIELTWDAPLSGDVLGYDVYISVNDIFTKLNAELITTESFVHTPTAPGQYKYYVNTLFNYEGFQIWSGGSDVITQDYYLPIYAKVELSEVWVADARFPDNTTYYTKISPAVAKEYEGIETEITLSSSDVVSGTVHGDWLGAGSTITRVYDDAKRTITQVITIEDRRIVINNSVEYKASVNIDYEGFKFTGHVAFSNKINAFGSGSGQHIINNTGMYFHHGAHTQHRALTSAGTAAYQYKEYSIGNTEWNKLYLMDGRDNVPVRILSQPDGRDATICLTNHCDGDTQKTRETIWLGSSKSDDSARGVKGMIARGIKADWSAFTNGVLQWYQTADYKAFLHTVENAGNEMVPHGLQVNLPIPRSTAITYLPLIKAEYAPSNWIDHSLGSAKDTMGFCSKGWDISDPDYYALDLLEENGFNKSWSYENADKELELNYWGFDHHIVFYNDHLKLPLSGNHIALWKSSDKPLYRGWLNIAKIIRNCDIVIAHEYMGATGGASTRESLNGDTGKYTRTYYSIGDGDYRITSGFDALLNNIAEKKLSGQIWNPTATDFVEYFKLLKNITIELTDANTIVVTNNNSAVVNGFSLLICRKNITPSVNGTALNKKDVFYGTTCWLDLPVGNTTINTN